MVTRIKQGNLSGAQHNAWPRASSRNLAADIMSRNSDKEEREQHGACVHSNRATLGKSCRRRLKKLFCQALSLGAEMEELRHRQSCFGLQVTKSDLD